MAKLDKLWVVVNPTLTSGMSEIMFPTTAAELARYVRGCVATGSRDDENIAVHDTEYSASVDAGDRVAALRRHLEAVNGQIQDARRAALPKVGTESSDNTRDLWAQLRGKANLSEVADMVRQDIEALIDTDVGNAEDLAAKLRDVLARAV